MTDMMKTLRESLPSANDVLHRVGLEREHRATSMSTAQTSVPAGQSQTTAPALQIKCPIRHQSVSVDSRHLDHTLLAACAQSAAW